MDPVDGKEASEINQEFRVQLTSKKQAIEQMKKCKVILNKALDGQPGIDEETKRVLLQELLANFESAVQQNVLVNGQTWEDAPDVDAEDEGDDLESQLDDTIVETARRRGTYPRRILPYVVQALKAERKLLGLYEEPAGAQQVVTDPQSENFMKDLSAAAPGLVKRARQVIKSICTLQQQAEGLCEVVNMKPSHTCLQVDNEVFGPGVLAAEGPPPSLNGLPTTRQPIKRAVEDAAAADAYVPVKHKYAGEAQ
uniref:kinetochore-associated protein NSL1 homolog n=1 Tax=Doryrhamphus excisus TaxID=161450 RepID=UPI0025AE64AC|nr:kinetochore-associated protein NSL1 homolog [Doryrhamphus excisus]XP_057901955.1 kinetochore-associated protein NSL1 homolog [Doryrhamphus excisus]XP_057901957.1 kinetochore-associated protein NSL1 homolog [Doryrhamphus excisus]XP_057901958.1 kinetochore-associated protein NSL1 homolog [Doryrhamphus excisus]